ncbi:MAG: hypothetical protein OXC07_08845 [Kistimonas sp.]|nr:hypothetical protein [Kistimonas sp.]
MAACDVTARLRCALVVAHGENAPAARDREMALASQQYATRAILPKRLAF